MKQTAEARKALAEVADFAENHIEQKWDKKWTKDVFPSLKELHGSYETGKLSLHMKVTTGGRRGGVPCKIFIQELRLVVDFYLELSETISRAEAAAKVPQNYFGGGKA
jgi:hypothetical protein